MPERARFRINNLYRQRASAVYAGYVAGGELALLTMRTGRADPYKIYERMRARGTLNPIRLGNWATTSYRVCDSVLRDRRFGAGYVSDRVPAHPPGVNRSFLLMNPPDHTRLRRVAVPAFTPKAVAGYQPRIEKLVGELLDEAAEKREFDLVSAFAAPLPITIITDLLGFPESDTEAFNHYGMIISSGFDGIRSGRHAAQLREARGQLVAMFEQHFELRGREPQEDIISHLVQAQGEDRVQPAELLPLCLILLIAGLETTTNLIANGTLACWTTRTSGRRSRRTRKARRPGWWRRRCASRRRSRSPAGSRSSRWNWRGRRYARARWSSPCSLPPTATRTSVVNALGEGQVRRRVIAVDVERLGLP
jgi:cytochrome P450